MNTKSYSTLTNIRMKIDAPISMAIKFCLFLRFFSEIFFFQVDTSFNITNKRKHF